MELELQLSTHAAGAPGWPAWGGVSPSRQRLSFAVRPGSARGERPPPTLARPSSRSTKPRAGFTLMEIMIVVGIMGIMLTLSVPIVWKVLHKPPLDKAITDIIEVCSNARARAILQGHEVDLIIHPHEGRFDLSSTAPPPSPNPTDPSAPVPVQSVPLSMSGSGLSAQLSDRVVIEELDINKIPGGFKDAEQARVRFFPNGTSDELALFLRSDQGKQCEILTEVTTGLASVEWDVHKFR